MILRGSGSPEEVRSMRSTPWNHNIHYHPVVLSAVPSGAHRVLDVGCGDGMLTRELGAVAANVIGIDKDAPSLERARAHGDIAGVAYLHGDFLAYPFDPSSFDAIVSVAALHHMHARTALERMRSLLRPGGVLVAVGLARGGLADVPISLCATAVHQFFLLRRVYLEQASPTVWPPPESYAGMRELARAMLPGARYRRHLLWRYSLVWTKPRVLLPLE
jgi:SAM-dependent methyltransferase